MNPCVAAAGPGEAFARDMGVLRAGGLLGASRNYQAGQPVARPRTGT